ncbi:MAG: chromosomal replication initiator DnaA [Acetobacteraceae bacterium]|nr:chromosomal replication initiator DnaA [Pseudomonadota bacterium]
MAPREQLPLPFPHEPLYAPHDFFPADCNHAALAWLDRMQDWPDRRLLVWGEEGCGKTHLLRVWAARTGAAWLDGRILRTPEDLPPSGAAALDDADLVTPETTLLHVLNTARDRGLSLLLTARQPPARWPVALPDLASRLRAMATVEIAPPDDAFLSMLFAMLLADRQLQVPPAVQDWLLRRLPRTPAALREAAAKLDRLSLAGGRRVTRALASRLLPASDSWEDREVSVTRGASSSKPIGLL